MVMSFGEGSTVWEGSRDELGMLYEQVFVLVGRGLDEIRSRRRRVTRRHGPLEVEGLDATPPDAGGVPANQLAERPDGGLGALHRGLSQHGGRGVVRLGRHETRRRSAEKESSDGRRHYACRAVRVRRGAKTKPRGHPMLQHPLLGGGHLLDLPFPQQNQGSRPGSRPKLPHCSLRQGASQLLRSDARSSAPLWPVSSPPGKTLPALSLVPLGHTCTV